MENVTGMMTRHGTGSMRSSVVENVEKNSVAIPDGENELALNPDSSLKVSNKSINRRSTKATKVMIASLIAITIISSVLLSRKLAKVNNVSKCDISTKEPVGNIAKDLPRVNSEHNIFETIGTENNPCSGRIGYRLGQCLKNHTR